jgi:hypothetical protein
VRIGVSDIALMQRLGVELLNTEDYTRQPVQWFSDPNTTQFILPAHLAGAFRYLDVTEFAQQVGWQIQVSGTQLLINSPIAKVQALRQAKQSWGDRFVIELDRPTSWRVNQSDQDFVLTLDAQVEPSLLSQSGSNPASGAESTTQIPFLLSQPNSDQAELRLNIPASLHPRVWSLPNPNRLIVDVRSDALINRNILWAPGLRWRSQIIPLNGEQIPVMWLHINLRQPGLRMLPILPNSTTAMGTAPLVQTAQRSQTAAAINGGFFNRNNRFALGALRREGRWLAGPILNRGAIAWNSAGEVRFGRLTLQETLTTPSGNRFPLTHLNSAYIQAGIARYTPDWGKSYTPFSDHEIVVTVQNQRVVRQQAFTQAGSDSVPIPANGYLLVLRSSRTAATTLRAGTQLRLESTLTPSELSPYPNIIAAGPLLLQNGQTVLDASAEKFSKGFAEQRASRSAIGQMVNGDLIIAAVHNRLDGSGISLAEIAELMRQLGAIHALNLDGGSSTTLYLGGQIIDRPPQTAARVQNGIGIEIRSSGQR